MLFAFTSVLVHVNGSISTACMCSSLVCLSVLDSNYALHHNLLDSAAHIHSSVLLNHRYFFSREINGVFVLAQQRA